MRCIHHLIAAGLTVFLLCGEPVYVQAATIFSEDYEVADMTALRAGGWNLTCSSSPCTTDLVSSPVHGGSKALRQTYVGSPYNPDGSLHEGNNSKITITFSGVPELYERYYVRYSAIDSTQPSGFGPPSALQNGGGKQHYFNVSVMPNFYSIAGRNGNTMESTNQSNVDHLCPNGRTGITCNFPINQTSVPLKFNVWHCIETHLGQTIIEQWVDGILTARHTDIIAPATYNSVQIYRQVSENLYRYEDDLVLATTRVGCSGNPSADTTPPAAPRGLVFSN